MFLYIEWALQFLGTLELAQCIKYDMILTRDVGYDPVIEIINPIASHGKFNSDNKTSSSHH